MVTVCTQSVFNKLVFHKNAPSIINILGVTSNSNIFWQKYQTQGNFSVEKTKMKNENGMQNAIGMWKKCLRVENNIEVN